MIDEVPAVMPVQSHPIEIVVPDLADTAVPAPLADEQIHLVDRAFGNDQEKVDAAAGLIGLWLSSPWLLDLVADHFRKPAEEDDDSEKLRVKKRR